MLNDPPITEITKKIENTYTLAMTVAKRARQITDRNRELMVTGAEKAVSQAAKEVYIGDVIITTNA